MAERAQVDHDRQWLAVHWLGGRPEERSPAAIGERGVPDDLAAVVDAAGVACTAAERAQVEQLAVLPYARVCLAVHRP